LGRGTDAQVPDEAGSVGGGGPIRSGGLDHRFMGLRSSVAVAASGNRLWYVGRGT